MCQEQEIESPHIILVVGQSNTHYGLGLDAVLDATQEGIYQLGRFGSKSDCIILAEEPLDHHTKADDRIGFALTFAKELYQHQQGANQLIIVPCGFGGTGFIDNRWNKSNDLYEDAVCRVDALNAQYPEGSVVAILWHQGETDAYLGNTNYQQSLDNFIVNLRADLHNDSIPMIVGGMVPYWVNQDADWQQLQQILKETPIRNSHLGYVDPEVPFIIEKPDNTFDEIHYDAAGQRELGRRYFQQFLLLTE